MRGGYGEGGGGGEEILKQEKGVNRQSGKRVFKLLSRRSEGRSDEIKIA